MPSPGILWVNSDITSSSLTPARFKTWYDTIHVPDILKTGSVALAARYKNTDPAVENPYLAIYHCPDKAFLGSDAYYGIETKDDRFFPGPSHECFESARFDSRFWEYVEGFEKEKKKVGGFCTSPIRRSVSLFLFFWLPLPPE